MFVFISASCGVDEAEFGPTAGLHEDTVFDAQAGIRAVELQIADCMRALGFDYLPVNPNEVSEATAAGVVITVTEPMNELNTSDAEQAAYFTALHGDDSSPGCIEQAAYVEELQSIDIDVYNQKRERTRANPEVVDAEIEWSRCMADQGIEVSSPNAMAALLRESAVISEKRLDDAVIASMEVAALQCDDDYYVVFWRVFQEFGLNK